MEKNVWTRHGWIRLPIAPVEQECIRKSIVLTSLHPYGADYAQPETRDFYSLFREINLNIQAGTPGLAIDALPNSFRMLYQDTSRMYVTKNANAVLMKESTDEQTNTGSFEEDKDKDFKTEMKQLEEEGLVNWTSIQEDTKELRNFIHEEQTRRRVYIVEDYEDLISAAEETGDIELVEEHISNCVEELKNLPSDKEYGYMLNSGVTGKGYKASDNGYKRVDSSFSQDGSIMAEVRRQNFNQLFHEMTMCRTKRDIWGIPNNKEDGTVEFTGGFMAKLRKLYVVDKELWEAWSPAKKKTARTEFIKTWRDEFWNGNGGKGNPLKDEVSLKKNLYFRFDMTAIDELDEYSEKSKKVIKGKKRKPSLWDRQKAKAFNELHMTRDQWSTIYIMKDVMLHRIAMDKDGFDDVREEAIQELRSGFKAIETLEDLQLYSLHAHHRVWKKRIFHTRRIPYTVKTNTGETKTFYKDKNTYVQTYAFEPSLIDKISIRDEANWVKAMRELGRKLSKKTTKVEE